ncbi:MAG: SDR family NAD(P)-dependent oxidoreductase [Haloarculaceae archaeon]
MVTYEGKTVVVTGGGRGIGRAACEEFGRLGANVVVNDVGGEKTGEGGSRRPAEEVAAAVEERGGTAVPEFSDVGTMAGAEAVVDTALAEFGDLDAVYNNAGILRESSLVSMTEAEFDEVIRVHLKGMFAVLQQAARHWRAEHKDGVRRPRRVVNASSDVSIGAFSTQGSAFGLGNYAMAKAGILGLTRTAAEELSEYGVRVNAIWPMAHTRLSDPLPLDLPDPAPVAAAVAYLASEDCPVNGQTVRIGGDQIELIAPAPLSEYTAFAGGEEWTTGELADRFPETLAPRARDPFT